MFTWLLLFTYLFTYVFRPCRFRVRQLLHLHQDLKLKRDYPLLIIKFIKWKVIIEEIHLMEDTKHQGKIITYTVYHMGPYMGFMDKIEISHGSAFFEKYSIFFIRNRLIEFMENIVSNSFSKRCPKMSFLWRCWPYQTTNHGVSSVFENLSRGDLSRVMNLKGIET